MSRRGEDPAAGRTSAEVERDIEATRREMAHTLDELDRKLAPSELGRDVFRALKNALVGEEGSQHMMESISKNPILVAMIGIGAAWLLFGGGRANGGGSASHASSRHSGSSTMSGVREGLSSARDRAGSYASSIGSRSQDMAERTREYASRASGTVGEYARDNPVALGAVGLLLGTAIGALLPSTAVERSYIGATADEALDRVERMGEDMAHRAERVASEAGEAAADAAKREFGHIGEREGDSADRNTGARSSSGSSGNGSSGGSSGNGSSGSRRPGSAAPGTTTTGASG